MSLRNLFSRNENGLKDELEKKDNALNSAEFKALAWQRLYEEDSQALESTRKENVGLKILLDQKDAEIEELKEQIRGCVS